MDLQADTIDRSLWVALLAAPNVDPATVRARVANQTLALGIYPTNECAGKDLEPLAAEPQVLADPGLVFEIAAPDPKDLNLLPAPRYERLPVEYAENVLEMPGIVQVQLPAVEVLNSVTRWDFDPIEEGTLDYPPLLEDKALAKRLVTWLRIRLPLEADKSTKGAQAQLSWVGVNAARVVQAIRVEGERLGTGNGAPDQAFKVANTPVIVEAPATPGTAAAAAAAAGPGFLLEVESEPDVWQQWQQTDDLYAAAPDARVYALDPEAGVVSFGSGLRGMRPPLGRGIRASYEYGGGLDGKVAIDAISKAPALPGGYKVSNPVPTWGAAPGESVATGQKNIARTLKHRDRLVTIGDFKDITLRTPGIDIGRVEVLPLFNPESFAAGDTAAKPGTVTVMVAAAVIPVQEEPPPPDRLFLNAVCEWLGPRRLVTTQVFVRSPQYIQLWVTVGIVTMPGYLRSLVYRDVKAAIREYLSPLVGGPPVTGAPPPEAACSDVNPEPEPCPVRRGSGWPLGMEVRAHDLEAVAVRVEGVRYVDSVRLGVKQGGVFKQDIAAQRMAGIELPWLADVSVREGPAEDPGIFLGEGPDAAPLAGNRVPVAAPPKKC